MWAHEQETRIINDTGEGIVGGYVGYNDDRLRGVQGIASGDMMDYKTSHR